MPMVNHNDRNEEPAGATDQLLQSIVDQFSAEPSRYGRLMRELLSSHYQDFPAAAVNVLRKPTDARGARYLIALLWTNELLIPILGDVTLPRELCLQIGQVAATVDTRLHIRLVQLLVAGMLEGRERDEQSTNRLLEVLGAVSDGFGIQGFLRQMLQHPNPRIRSKVTLLVGSGGYGIRAIQKLLTEADEDARVRANAIEALWQCPHPDAVSLYLDCLGDSDNRVAGNAALGLYFSGDPKSIPAIRGMATSSDPRFQRTAVWIVGKTGDPRFLPLLVPMMAESDGGLRKSVFRALTTLKRAAAKRAQNPPLGLEILDVEANEPQTTRVRLALTTGSGGAAPPIPATGFALLAGGKPIDHYTCVEHRNDQMWTAFILPRRPVPTDPLPVQLREALMACLHTKLPGERWGIVRYRETWSASAERAYQLFGQTMGELLPVTPAREHGVNFTGSVAVLRSEIESHGLRVDRDWNAFGAIRSTVQAAGSVHQTRSCIVVVDSPQTVEEDALEDLIRLIRDNSFVIHALTTRANEQLARLCRETDGIFRLVPDVALAGSEVQLLYQVLKNHYSIEFRSSELGARDPLIVRAFNASASGEVRLDRGIRDSQVSSELVFSDAPMSAGPVGERA
jgi:hypothetical protein